MLKFFFGTATLIALCLQPAWACAATLADVEKEIRKAVISESAGLASLEAVFIVTFASLTENYVESDDVYIQKDKASLDYGFRIDERNIRVVTEGGDRKVLRVRLPKATLLATNRVNLETQTTHKGFRPKDKDKKFIDVDAEINKELNSLNQEYAERTMSEAGQNIKNFFRILAAKYGLELDFSIE